MDPSAYILIGVAISTIAQLVINLTTTNFNEKKLIKEHSRMINESALNIAINQLTRIQKETEGMDISHEEKMSLHTSTMNLDQLYDKYKNMLNN